MPSDLFVSISRTWQTFIVVYFVFWRIVPILAVSLGSKSFLSFDIFIALSTSLTEVLILYPFLRRQIGNVPIGWLHPLILPTAISLLFGILRAPMSLLNPILIWIPQAGVGDDILIGLPTSTVLDAQLKLNLINILAIFSTYVGFIVRKQLPIGRVGEAIRLSGFRISVIFLLCMAVVLVFLQIQGGVIEHMSSLGAGRYAMRVSNGQYILLNTFLPYLLILWYAYRPAAMTSWLFMMGFLSAAVLQFIVTGSRSGLFTPFAMLLVVWVYHNRRLPVARALLIGISFVIMLGVLGDVRRSGRDGEIDFSALTNFDLTTAFEMSEAEFEGRQLNTDLAVVALVPEHQNHLWGATYISAAAFWLPRSIWEDKPRGAGAFAAAFLYQGRTTMDGYDGAAFPVGGAAEAYWNFAVPGVVIVFLIYGIGLGAAARWLLYNPANPFALTVLVLVVFGVRSPSTGMIVPALHIFTLLYIVRWIARIRPAAMISRPVTV